MVGKTCPVCTAELLQGEKPSSPAFHFSNLKGKKKKEEKGTVSKKEENITEEAIKKKEKKDDFGGEHLRDSVHSLLDLLGWYSKGLIALLEK